MLPDSPAQLLACGQETGRAGRDGKEAHVILYYSYQDAVKSRHMISEGAKEHKTPPEQLQCNKEALNAMVSQRQQLLTYLVRQ